MDDSGASRPDRASQPLRFDAVIFDLDGTLVDTLEDLADAVNRVLASRGWPTHGYDAYRYMIGGGVRQLVAAALPVEQGDETTISDCLERMIAFYREHLLDKTRVYDGVAETLRELKQAGVPMGVLSNKADDLTQPIVAALFEPGTFKVVLGARPDVPLKPDPAGAAFVGARLGVAPARVACLGDSGSDMVTAHRAGMIALGAAWGFRSADELRESGALRVLVHPRELPALRAP